MKLQIYNGKSWVEFGRNGVDSYVPIKGVDYFTLQEIETFKKEILSSITLPETDLSVSQELVKKIIQVMHTLPEKDKLEVSKGIRNAQSFIYKGTKYGMEEMMHGGGSSSSGSTLTAETPTGTVDDSNQTFTVAHTPLYIVVNGGQYTAGQGIFASYVAPTITLNAPVGSTGFIQSFYNS